MFANEFAEEIFEKKYAGVYRHDPEGFYRNMAHQISLGDAELEESFYEMLIDQRFSPGGRILAWTGHPSASVSLMNCTTHTIEHDTLESIADAVRTVMAASSHGQGIGLDLTNLRPRDALVNNAARTSTGAISFMEMLNSIGSTIGQEGRRAALLFSLSVEHPDLWRQGAQDVECHKCHGKGCKNCNGTGYLPYDFLHIKSIPGHVEGANISVMVTNDFMYAVKEDRMWSMSFYGKSGVLEFQVERPVKARELFMELAKMAYYSAEPGVLFSDTIHSMSNSDAIGSRWKVVGCNACSEMMLDQDGVCNLGSLNLGKYVLDPYTDKAEFNYGLLTQDVFLAVEFLDNVLELELNDGRSISEAQRESVEWLRRVGLGVMGLADALVKMGLRYNPEDIRTHDFVAGVFHNIMLASYMRSVELAEKKGPCLAWEYMTPLDTEIALGHGFYKTLPGGLKKLITVYGLRNTTLLSIAPTGSISNLCGASSGVEPIFAREYVRRVRMDGDDKFITYVHPGVAESRAAGLPDNVWDTAHDVSAEDHVRMQALIQHFIDSAIAKTTNLPSTATIEDVANIYMLAWELGLKGITVYVDGSREEQVLYKTEEGTDESCPNCNSPVVKHGGCTECPSCGWSKCSL